MRNAEWSEGMDEEHRRLFRLCDDLQCALAAGASASGVRPIVDELVTDVAEHFAHEERVMRQTGYGLLAWHRQRHDAARSRVTALQKQIRHGNRAAAVELMEFMLRWLNEHIGLADRMLTAFLRNHERELAVRGQFTV